MDTMVSSRMKSLEFKFNRKPMSLDVQLKLVLLHMLYTYLYRF